MTRREEQAVDVARALHAAYRDRRERLVGRDDFRSSHTDAELRTDYYMGTLASAERVVRMARCWEQYFRLARFDPVGKVIVDVGSGFGIHGRLFARWGARKVVGIDVVPVHRIVDEAILAPASPELPFEHREATSSRTGLPAGYADCITVCEGVSHFRDVDRFWDEAARLLAPDGVLILVDSNNGRNLRIRRRLVEDWQGYERRYRAMRAEFIAERHPEIAAGGRDILAEESSGMDFAELDAACAEFGRTGRTPGRRYVAGAVPLNPKDRILMEAAVDPYACAEALRRAGLEPRVRACYTASRRGVWEVADGLLGALTPLTVRWAPSFVIVARATPGPQRRNGR